MSISVCIFFLSCLASLNVNSSIEINLSHLLVSYIFNIFFRQTDIWPVASCLNLLVLNAADNNLTDLAATVEAISRLIRLTTLALKVKTKISM